MAYGTHYAPTGLTPAQEYRLQTAPCSAATANAIRTCTDAELVGYCRVGNPEAVRRAAVHEARRRLPIRRADEAAQRAAAARFRSRVREAFERALAATTPSQAAPDPAAEILAQHEQQKAVAALPHGDFKRWTRATMNDPGIADRPVAAFADGYVPTEGVAGPATVPGSK